MHVLRSTALLGAAMLPLLAATAHAQDAGTTATTGDAAASSNYDPDWRAHTYNGPYVSGAIGWANGANGRNTHLFFDRDNNGTYGDTVTTATGANAIVGRCRGYYVSTIPGDCRADRNKIDWALRAGWDKRMGNFVVGGLFEGSTNDTRDATSAFDSSGNAYRIARGIDYGFALRGRVGWTPNGGGLFYATGGVSYSKMKHIFRTTNTANAFTEVDPDTWRWGWQAGGGAEAMVTPRIGVGLEWLYNRIHDSDYRVAVTQGSAGATSPFVLAGGQTNMRASKVYQYNTIRGTLTYHF
ncbi:MAG: porin family protein [Sphingomonadales bacterium]|nr:porin family protein [Sphingomonadales bacterium]